MTIERFRASVQYNDWKGSSAADNADKNGSSTWLKKTDILKTVSFC